MTAPPASRRRCGENTDPPRTDRPRDSPFESTARWICVHIGSKCSCDHGQQASIGSNTFTRPHLLGRDDFAVGRGRDVHRLQHPTKSAGPACRTCRTCRWARRRASTRHLVAADLWHARPRPRRRSRRASVREHERLRLALSPMRSAGGPPHRNGGQSGPMHQRRDVGPVARRSRSRLRFGGVAEGEAACRRRRSRTLHPSRAGHVDSSSGATVRHSPLHRPRTGGGVRDHGRQALHFGDAAKPPSSERDRRARTTSSSLMHRPDCPPFRCGGRQRNLIGDQARRRRSCSRTAGST